MTKCAGMEQWWRVRGLVLLVVAVCWACGGGDRRATIDGFATDTGSDVGATDGVDVLEGPDTVELEILKESSEVEVDGVFESTLDVHPTDVVVETAGDVTAEVASDGASEATSEGTYEATASDGFADAWPDVVDPSDAKVTSDATTETTSPDGLDGEPEVDFSEVEAPEGLEADGCVSTCSSNDSCVEGYECLCTESSCSGSPTIRRECVPAGTPHVPCPCAASDSCRRGERCLPSSAGTDASTVCWAPVQMCRPCRIDGDCRVDGWDDSRCVEAGFDGRVCSVGCEVEQDCPEGYECADDASQGKLCRPAGGAVCPCTEAFQLGGFLTVCYAENVHGRCEAMRTCGQACPAAMPTGESCDGQDNDCDGLTDEEGASGCQPSYGDGDHDGWGSGAARCLCVPEPSATGKTGDCDDGDPTANPGAVEACNGRDDDCDGGVDERDALGCDWWYLDADGDAWGVAGAVVACLCEQASPYTGRSVGDCNPADAAVHPGAEESCNGRDDNCDGTVDEPDAAGCLTWFGDLDEDGWGEPSLARCVCGPTGIYLAPAVGDCAPYDADVHPGAVEVCNTLDDDCDGLTDEEYVDSDGDGTKDCVDTDRDGDGVIDEVDDCPDAPDALQENTDQDRFGDACDFDDDADGIADVVDNCRLLSNVAQKDTDGDGLGDTCDPDLDDDGVSNADDNCPDIPNADQVDCNGNGVGDACVDDDDVDGVSDAVDNCACVRNATQSDVDEDGLGDACDAEDCDGIDNDGDSKVDEGLPDDDEDGTCNVVDACPLDGANDADGDSLCAPDDNCPYTANPSQADDDLDGRGDVCDIDSDEACGESAPLDVPGAKPIPASLAIKDIVADPAADLVYVAVGATDPTYPNALVALHGATPSVAWSLSVGSDPSALAISSDGKVLYVGLWGAAGVRVVDPGKRRACHQFPVGIDASYGALRAGDIDVLPGQPEMLVVSARRVGVSPDFAGVFLFDNGSRRPNHTPNHTGARMITVASDTVVYGFNNSSTEFGFRKLAIGDDGVSEEWVVRDLIQSFSADILFSGGRVYATTGEVFDPVAPQLVGTTGCSGRVAVEPLRHEIFCTSSASVLTVYDSETFVSKRTISVVGLSGSPTKAVRWGSRGLALASTTDIVFLPAAVSLP